jgi:glycerophosphoryl diester phosphodiesterase
MKNVFSGSNKGCYIYSVIYLVFVIIGKLSAFRKAVDMGYGIELDVQLSADGEVMVFHDENLLRMTGCDASLYHKTAAELSALRLSGSEEHIPTLAEVLSLVGGRVPLLVEIKSDHGTVAVCEKTAALLDSYAGEYMIESFHPFALDWMRKNRPNILRGQLSSNFFGHKESGNNLQFFAVKNLLLNVIARPDFIAYDIRYPNTWAFRLCRDVWKAFPIGWTVRSKEELEEAKKYFDAWICENIY